MVSPYLNRPIRTLDQVLQARPEPGDQPREAPALMSRDILARPQRNAPKPVADRRAA